MNPKAYSQIQPPAFSLLELLTVIAIVAITAAFAIPSYVSYVIQTKVNTMWQLAEPAKLEVMNQYLRKRLDVEQITVNAGIADYTAVANNDSIKCITIQGGQISVVGNPSYFYDKNIWISWTPTV